MPHPDEQIVEKHRASMNHVAQAIDKIFNPEGDKETCFVLLIAPFGSSERCNYISNGKRSDIITLMKEITARFEGQPELSGRA